MRIPKPHIKLLDDYTIELTQPFVWGKEMVPAGFQCDGASVPKIANFYATPFGPGGMLPAALFHDYHYHMKIDNTGKPMGHFSMLRDGTLAPITRAEADLRFYHRLRLNGVRTSKAWLCYWALRAAGRFAWQT